MTNFDPTANYSAGGATGAFPGTGTGAPTATEDSIYGISKRLAVVPVNITSPITGNTPNSLAGMSPAERADYAAGGTAGSGQTVIHSLSGQQLPWESALGLFYRMSNADRAKVQQALGVAGLLNLKARGVTLGFPDAASYAAWGDLVRATVRANSAGSSQTIDQTLQSAIAAQQANTANDKTAAIRQGLTGGGQSYDVSLTNPTDIAAAAQRVATSVLGRKAGPDDIAKITAAIQGQERSNKQSQITAAESQSRATYNAQLASRDAVASGVSGSDTYLPGITTTTTAAPSTQAEAEAQLRAAHPTEAAAHDSTGVYGTLMSLIRGGAGA